MYEIPTSVGTLSHTHPHDLSKEEKRKLEREKRKEGIRLEKRRRKSKKRKKKGLRCQDPMPKNHFHVLPEVSASSIVHLFLKFVVFFFLPLNPKLGGKEILRIM